MTEEILHDKGKMILYENFSYILNTHASASITEALTLGESLDNTQAQSISEALSMSSVLRYMHGDSGDGLTKLLIHADGNPGTASFLDFSTANHSMAQGVGSAFVTADSKFGSGAMAFDSASIVVTASADFHMGTSNFTVECWAKPTADIVSDNMFSLVVDGSNYVRVRFAGLLTQIIISGAAVVQYSTAYALSTAAYSHIAIIRYDNTIYTYVNGSAIGSATAAQTSQSWPDGGPADLHIGEISGSPGITIIMDEFRISKGIARWTSTFLPLDEPYKGFQLGKSISESAGLVSTVMIPGTPVSQLHENLVAYWTMHEPSNQNIRDIIGSAYLTAYSCASGPTQQGDFTMYLDHEQYEYYQSTSDITATSFTGDQTFTVVARVKPDQVSSWNLAVCEVYRKNDNYILYGLGWNSTWTFVLSNASSTITLTASIVDYPQWTTVGGMKSTAAVQLYVNGVMRDQACGAYTMSPSSVYDNIGGWLAWQQLEENKTIDWVAVFDAPLSLPEMGYVSQVGIDFNIKVCAALSLEESPFIVERQIGAGNPDLPHGLSESAGFSEYLYADIAGKSIAPPYVIRDVMTMSDAFMHVEFLFSPQTLGLSESLYHDWDMIGLGGMTLGEKIKYSLVNVGATKSEAISFGESILHWTENLQKTITESFAPSDSLSKTRAHFQSISNTLSLSDSLDWELKGHKREELGLNESLSYVLPRPEVYIHPSGD
jgi:hypothetical protein